MPVLKQHSCPYFELAEADHAICAMERKMFEKVLGRGLRLSQCRLDGHRSCDFEAKPIVEPHAGAGRLSGPEPTPAREPSRGRNRAGRLMSKVLTIENLHVAIDGKEILKGVDLTIRHGEIHALMGPNGSGKSTLGYAIMGHPNYEVTEGTITLDGEDLLAMEADERARPGSSWPSRPDVDPRREDGRLPAARGHQRPQPRPQGRRGADPDARVPQGAHASKMDQLGMDPEFARRYVNEGFSGGEMKRAEILQLAMLRPKFAILDETDSGLDVDAVRLVSEGVNQIAARARDGHPDHHPPRAPARTTTSPTSPT